MAKTKNTRRKTDKPRWSEETKLYKRIEIIKELDPKGENLELQNEKRKLVAEIIKIQGIW